MTQQNRVLKRLFLSSILRTAGFLCLRWLAFAVGVCFLAALTAPAQVTFSALNSFRGTNGAQPLGTLLLATNGLLYGTAAHGGDFDMGVVYSATTSGTIKEVASFDGTNGATPFAGLIQGSDGRLYGTASAGGDFDKGTIFAINTDGTLTNLYSFDGTNGNGARPLSPLIPGIDGNLYGTTSLGGVFNMGTIFFLSPTGAVVSVFSFLGANGSQPSGVLARGPDGTLYGTTAGGGAFGYGSVFAFSMADTLTTLKSFAGGIDGAGPQGGLIFAANGLLYGTTAAGGSNTNVPGGPGTVFSITTAGGFATVHSFVRGEGANASAAPYQAGTGTFYGTTAAGGKSGLGTIYSIGVNNAFTNVFSFSSSQGTMPRAGITVGTNGNLFGVTSAGGRPNVGTLFELSGIPPFIALAPTNQTVLEDSTVSFSVISGGTGPFTYQWQFNGNNLSDSKTVSGTRTATLTLSSVTPAQNGNYSVLVQSQAGHILSAAAVLSVIPVPTVSISSPRPNAIVKSTSVKVAGGTAGDAVVARVYFQLNDEGWQLATTADNWKHWSAMVEASLGTNTVQAFAESVVGTDSETNAVSFFAPPFIPLLGSYDGLFVSSNGFSPDSAGFVHLNLDYKGHFSGRLQMAGSKSPFTGQFNAAGNAVVAIQRSHETNLIAALHMDIINADNLITGTVTDGSFVSDLLANRATFDAKTNPAPFEGRYTFNISGSEDSEAAPGGFSWGTMTVSKGGKASVSVTLADNTHFSQSIPVATNGTFPLFSGLYSGKGVLQGWIGLTNPEPTTISGEVDWFKPALMSAKFYSNSFTLIAQCSGAGYVPTNIPAILNSSNAALSLIGADLDISITNQLTINSRNRVTVQNGSTLTLSYSQSTGAFRGTSTESETKRKLPFSGVMREDLGLGLGFFLGTNQSGTAILENAPTD